MSDSLLHSRVCRSCLIEKPDSEFYDHPDGLRGKRARCKECCNKWNRTQNHRDASKRWNFKHRATKCNIAKAYQATPNGREKKRANKSKHRAELSRSYVIQSIIQRTALKTKDVPLPLIEAARAVIKLKRTLWQNQKI